MRRFVVIVTILASALGTASASNGGEDLTSPESASPSGSAGSENGRAEINGPSSPSEACPAHPHPCGNEWPENLKDKDDFELLKVLQVDLESWDGARLQGWVGLPKLPEGVRAPVVLHSTPYLGGCAGGSPDCFPSSTPGNPDWWSDQPAPFEATGAGTWSACPGACDPADPNLLYPLDLVQNGYAAAFFNVRGTGGSGGCFNFFGEAEQKDQETLVEWLAGNKPHLGSGLEGQDLPQHWSNGRVAMGGVSYPGITALEAAVQRPASLKTIVVAGFDADLYSGLHTPQGAAWTRAGALEASNPVRLSVVPPIGETFASSAECPDECIDRLSNKFPNGLQRYVQNVPSRGCSSALSAGIEPTAGLSTDVRDEQWYKERNFYHRFPQVTTSVLVAAGFRETLPAFQDGPVWGALSKAPKRQIVGQWGHSFPTTIQEPWDELLLDWFGYWLKGVGSPDRLGVVDYQSSTDGKWRSDTSWPPAESRDEVLYLAGEDLHPDRTSAHRSFRSAPNPGNFSHRTVKRTAPLPVNQWEALCGTRIPGEGTGLAYLTDSFSRKATLAGNPFASLQLSSDQPGGLITAHLVELEAGWSCDETSQVKGVRTLSRGAADLRFHEGNYAGVDFPVNTPQAVRLDLMDIATTVNAGSKLALVLSYGDPVEEFVNRGHTPKITIHGGLGSTASHVLLPFVEGTAGGSAPTLSYPPRPFVPPPPIKVDIDIKPGEPNELHLSSSGLVAVAIKTEGGFDAATIDAATVCFGDAEAPAQRDCSEAHGKGHMTDIDADGDRDLLLHYQIDESGIDPEDSRACLHGATLQGIRVEGCDRITAS